MALNNVLTEVTAALNGQIDSANIPTLSKTLEGSNLALPQSFQVTGFKPSQMVVAQAFRSGVPITMTGAWSVDDDSITVSELFQITASGNVPLSMEDKYVILLKFT